MKRWRRKLKKLEEIVLGESGREWTDDELAELEDFEVIKGLDNATLRRLCIVKDMPADGKRAELLFRLYTMVVEQKRDRARQLKEERIQKQMMLESRGSVYCCGRGHDGQLGSADELLEFSEEAVVVTRLRGRGVRHVCVGFDGSTVLAVAEDNSVYSWGGAGEGPLGIVSLEEDDMDDEEDEPYRQPRRVELLDGDDIVSAAAGRTHAMALTVHGDLFVWGLNQHGQLGMDLDVLESPVPTLLKGIPVDETITTMSAGKSHSAAVTDKGKLYTWGLTQAGRLGLRLQRDEEGRLPVAIGKPMHVASLSRVLVTAVSCGASHTIAVGDHRLYSWGCGDGFRLGLGDCEDRSEPTLMEALPRGVVISISAAVWHSAAIIMVPPLLDNGLVYTWGSGRHSQLGLPGVTYAPLPQPVDFFWDCQERPIRISCGAFHNAVLTTTNSVYTWGSNFDGCLGRPQQLDQMGFEGAAISSIDKPGPMEGFDPKKVWGRGAISAIACGREFTVVCTLPFEGSTVEEWTRARDEEAAEAALREEHLAAARERVIADERSRTKRRRLGALQELNNFHPRCKLCGCTGFYPEVAAVGECRICPHPKSQHTVMRDPDEPRYADGKQLFKELGIIKALKREDFVIGKPPPAHMTDPGARSFTDLHK
eukprot:PLAT6664.2.p1 GENE.PLAT6664.2~~PLAT6664.2.p1  ORF type:complete len:652 (+),score=169.04 PLAT6664.2:47-2002(+)